MVLSQGLVTTPISRSARFRERLGQRIFELCGLFNLDNRETEAVLVGPDAERLAAEINLLSPVARVHSGGEALERVETASVIVIPLVPQVSDDSLDLLRFDSPRPVTMTKAGRRFVMDRPFLFDPGLGEAVEDVVRFARARARVAA